MVMANRRFDVFISFRGPDTRKTIVDYLYYRLAAAQINVFLDRETLKRGSDIRLSLEQGIKNSRIMIPIFSKNYAHSAWCLNEVLQMVESKKPMIPIFYDVEPQEVRHQHKGPYAEAFHQHKESLRYSEQTIQRWSRALHDACSISGWSLSDDFSGYQGKLVEKVTSQILRELQTTLQVPKFSVGLEERMARVITLLQMESDKKMIIVGIYGMGGTGKTTLATAVFNSIRSKFDLSCFLPDVRNTTHAELRKKIKKNLAHIDNDSAERENFVEGIPDLHISNALLVLDDVDDRDVLNKLLDEWFTLHGRIIVTTRDKGVMDERHNNVSYHVDELTYEQALNLFNWHAFSQEVPDKNYQYLTEKVVKACHGLPLTIEVIARLLYDKRDPKVWNEVLKQLKNVEINKIEERLRISYDDLNETEKEIFLDIACFFIGSEKHKAVSIWESSGWCPNLAIHNLHAKSLIKFTSDDRFQMHDILQDMGRAIVRKESPDDPGKRSRLWDEKEMRRIFKNQLVTNSLQGILCDSWSRKPWNADDFEPARNLRLLSINNKVIRGDFGKLTSQLRWLMWRNCSLDCLPVELNMKNMAVLELPESSIKQVWDDQFHRKVPKNLKVLNLSNCSQLERLPDLSKLQSLVKLDLHGCMSITTLPNSIGSLKKLEDLDLLNCGNLKELPHNLSGLVQLKKLNLSHCRSLTVLPATMGNLTSIRELELVSTSIAELPDCFEGMFQLEKLSISNCTALKGWPKSFGALHSLQFLDMDLSGFCNLPEEIGKLCQLQVLNLSSCSNLLELAKGFENLEDLKILRLNGNYKLTRLPGNLSGLKALQVLEASSCGLEALPAQFGLLRSLEVLHLGFNNFCTLPKNFKDLHKLTKLILHDCKELLELPFLPGNLVYVDISNCSRLKRVSDFSNMKYIETLLLHNCEKLECMSGMGGLQALVDLNITGCKNIRRTHVKGLDSLMLLERLHLGGTGVLVSNFQEWAKGRELIFYGNEIPEWLHHQMQSRVSKDFLPNSPLMEIRISMDQNVRCTGVIFCFVSYEKETAIDATIARGNSEVLRTQIVSSRCEDGRECGRDELHLFICHEKHIFARSLQDGDRICVWACPLVKCPRLWVKRGGVHLIYKREGEEEDFPEKQQKDKNLYHKLFLDLTWIQWSWLAWKNLPVNIDMHVLAAHDLASSFISRKICTYSLSPASEPWGHRWCSSQVVHVACEKAGMQWNFEESFELETELFGQIEAFADEKTVNMNRILLQTKNPEGIDGAIGRSNGRDIDINVGNRWLEIRKQLANGRSELLIELGVRCTRSSDVEVKKHAISSIWGHKIESLSSRTLKQSHLVLAEDMLTDKQQYYFYRV